jgi:hypothetical protein
MFEENPQPDESAPASADPQLDAVLRVVFGAILLFGGGYLALEFVHWLAHGGWSSFLWGLLIFGGVFLLLVVWSQILAVGTRRFRSMPVIYATIGCLTALGFLGLHFLHF